MINLLLAAWFSLPLYPLNPTEADTINSMNLHFTAGVNGPSSILSTGPEITVKYEYMFYYPYILRSSLDYRFGKVNSVVLPDGDIHRGMLSAEIIYYRGTNKLMGYLGAGIVYSFSSFKFNAAIDDSLIVQNEISDVSISRALGFRLTFGLRLKQVYSLEIGITEIRPKFVYYKNLGGGWFSESKEQFRFNDFKVSLGYILPLKM